MSPNYILVEYLFFSFILFILWIVIFFVKKNLRKEMIIGSILITPAAFVEFFSVPGYWHPDSLLNPKISIEDFIFSWSIGGLIVVSYELFVHKIKHVRLKHSFARESSHYLFLITGAVIAIFALFFFQFNFIYCFYLGMLVDIILIVLSRNDLWKKALYSGSIFALFYFIFFVLFLKIFFPDFTRFWNFSRISGIIIIGVPFEEILWAFIAGALGGIMYEYVLGIKLLYKRK